MFQPLETELDPSTHALLAEFGFDRATFERLRRLLASGQAEEDSNRIEGPLAPPEPGDVARIPPRESAERQRLDARGLDEVRAGRVAVLVLAGGMATRFGGMVKAAVPVLGNDSFLTLKLRDIHKIAELAQRRLRVCLMTSFATDALVGQLAQRACSEQLQVDTFPQFISLRVLPSGALFRGRDGRVSPYAPGHGDLSFALRRAGLLQSLRAEGVRYVFMSNVDNLAATLDPATIALHIERAAELSFEVVSPEAADKGGVPARLDGRLQIVEAMRYPAGFDARSIPLFSINSLVVSLDALDRDFDLTWFRVTKQVDGQDAVQFERLVNQLTAHLESSALWVERDGLDCRFLPVKDPPELARRLPMIERILSARGAL